MATLTDDKEQIRAEFRTLRHLYDKLKREYFSEQMKIRIQGECQMIIK